MWSYADLCDRIYAVAASVRAFYASAAASLQVSLNRHQAVRFVGQTVKSAVALVIIFSLLAWVPEVRSGAFWVIALFASPLILVALLWFNFRLWTRHGPPTVLSIVTAIGALSGIQYQFMVRDAARMAPLNYYDSTAIVTESRTVDLSDAMRSCTEMCLEILAGTNFDILLADRLYRRVDGDGCKQGARHASYIAFLKAGYVDTCYDELSPPRLAHVLRIGDEYCVSWEDDQSSCDQLPASFDGRIVTIFVDGHPRQRLVRRWLEGGIRPYNGWFVLVGLDNLPLGDWTDERELLSRALGIDLQGYGVTGTGDLDVILTELEADLDESDGSSEPWRAFWSLSRERGRNDLDTIERHIRRLVAMESRNHVLAGLNLATGRPRLDLADIRARLIELSRSPDPLVRDYALRALNVDG